MKFEKVGEGENALVEIILKQGEHAMIERGSMVYHDGNVELTGELNSRGGGFLSALGRSLVSGESLFITKAVGKAPSSKIAVAPCVPGIIEILQVSDANPWTINDGAFLACGGNVNYRVRRQSVSQGFLGTGGLFVMESTGTGEMLIHSCGDIKVIELDGTAPFVVDNDRALAWTSSLDYTVEAASGLFGFTTGEGFVNRYSGRGTILVQTRNFKSAVMRYAPAGK